MNIRYPIYEGVYRILTFLCHFPIVLIKNFHKERLFLLTIMFTLDTFFFNSSFMCQARTIFPLSIPYFCLIIKINRRTMTKIKEEHSFQRVRLMKQAAAIRQNNGMNRHDALVTAHRIGALIRQMHHGNVRFHYTRQDGSVRHAIGTLTGYEHSFHQPYIPRPENTFVVYYDIEAKGWRTFHAENFLDIDAEDEPEKTRTE